MDAKRISTIIVTDLTNDILKLQENLEFSINKDSDIDEKIIEIKRILAKIVNTEAMLVKFTQLINSDSNNNNNNNNN